LPYSFLKFNFSPSFDILFLFLVLSMSLEINKIKVDVEISTKTFFQKLLKSKKNN